MDGKILTSPDGKTWSSETSGTNSPLNAVCYNNNILVAVGNSGAILQETVSGPPSQSPLHQLLVPVIANARRTTCYLHHRPELPFSLMGSPTMRMPPPLSPMATPMSRCATWPRRWALQTAWDGTTQKVTVTKGSTTIELTIGSTTGTTNGQASQMEAAPLLVNGRTYLPARDIAEALGYTVEWDAAAQTVNIIGKQ